MSARQFIRSLLFFSLLGAMLFGLHYVVVFGVRHSENDRIGKINQLMSHQIDEEIMIFGASEGETGIAPQFLEKKLGKSAFNMSIDGTTVSQFGDLIKEYNNYSKKGEYVVLAMGVFSLQARDMPSSPNWYYSWIDNKHISENYLLNKMPEFRRYKYFPLYGFVIFNASFYRASFDGWKKLLTDRSDNSCFDNDGWRSHDLVWGQHNSLQKLTDQKVIIDPFIFDQYKEAVESVNAKGRKVILVMMPSWKGAHRYYHGYDELITKLESLNGDQNIFLDYSNVSFAESQDYFYNYTHLNRKGAELFSEMLANDVQQAITADQQKTNSRQ